MSCRSPLLALVFASLVAAPADAAGPVMFGGAVLNGSNGITGMGRPNDVVTSPDGRFVYAVATANQSILWFARNATTGALTFVDRVVSSTATPPGTIPHLDRPFAIATSPDGEHLYVAAGIASAGTSAITWFDRDLGTGAITYRGSLTDGSGPGLYALDTPVDVLVSGDGANVYVTAFEARAITAFARDAQSGDLSFLQVVADDTNGVDGLEGIQRLAESPDGTSLYVASASRPTTVPGVGGVAAFARAPNGMLTFLEVEQQGVAGVNGLWAPRDVTVSPDGAHVYVAAGGRPGDTPPQAGGIARFDRAMNGTLSFVAAIPDSLFGGGEPHGIAMSPDGASVYAISYGRYSGVGGLTPGKLAVFARNAQSGALTLVDRFDSGSEGVIGLAGAIALNVTPDGFVYVASELDPQSPPPGTITGALGIFPPAPPGPECSNGIDDDGDGLFDSPADPKCASAADLSESPDCKNSLDDDGDGLVDYPADPGCTSATDSSETVDCTNGIDDDGDGLIDAADPACSNPQLQSRENPRCDDGIDNDGDGAVDWDGGPGGATPDPQCSGKPFSDKEDAGCGIGAELALLAPLYARLRRKRMARPS
ncbi:MAG: beta-propeller fold lactonase family protein [Proteobacteria bacterium]|nr:beta-propeller fold lactonase family protein [Pseudomonadota bacterium]